MLNNSELSRNYYLETKGGIQKTAFRPILKDAYFLYIADVRLTQDLFVQGAYIKNNKIHFLAVCILF